MKHLIFTILFFNSLNSQAFGSYERIWRGFALADKSPKEFVHALNHALFPATGDLAHRTAQLQAYLPVVVENYEQKSGIPNEFAFLSYQSEASYRSYRNTPEGRQYGKLHWDLFEKEKSKSIVPEPFDGTVAVEHAYRVIPKPDKNAYGSAGFSLTLRTTRSSEYLRDVTKLMNHRVLNTNLIGYYVLIAEDYFLEYSFYKSSIFPSEDFLSRDVHYQLDNSTKIQDHGGIDFPISRVDKNRSERAVWKHHINAWQSRDLDELLEDYLDTSVVIHNDFIYRGKKEIRILFTRLFAQFDRVIATEIDRVTIEPGIIHITWWADTEDGLSSGTDTFLVENNFIVTQTITSL